MRDFSELVARWIKADWPAKPHIKAWVSTRAGDWNKPPYDGFNTADHVGDSLQAVQCSRSAVQYYFNLPQQPIWLNQVHSNRVVEAVAENRAKDADASWTRRQGMACVIHTADCLPVFFCNRSGSQVALAHAGWRGLLNGVLENTLATFSCAMSDVLVWFGPAIGPQVYEVGENVRQAFVQRDSSAVAAFTSSDRPGHWYCDLYQLARQRLRRAGVTAMSGGDLCTFQDPRFFSYRRQNTTGRVLSLLWIDADQ